MSSYNCSTSHENQNLSASSTRDTIQDSTNTSSDTKSIEEVQDEISSKVIDNDKDKEDKPCDVDFLHSKMHQERIPAIGIRFETEKSAHEFYNHYAYKFGFDTRLSKAHKKVTGFLTDRLFVCSAEGKRGKDKRNVHVKINRAETRFRCQAKMQIKYDELCRSYVVTEFIADHTHLTSTPRKTHRLRSYRKMSVAQNVMADMAEDSGINLKQTLELMSRQAGGREHLGFVAEDYRNYLRSKRTEEMKIGDTGGVLEYLQNMQSKYPSFTYAIQVDIDDLITNIFWADAKMKVDYDYFGDVVCFDTTYRKNKEGRPFAMFCGVNNHKQTVIFGAALLYDETAEIFMWLFDTFAKTMSEKKPKSIFTDQDSAMDKALTARWPETHHRLCIWHIYQNAAKNLKCVFENFKDFAREFSSIIYDYEVVEHFILAWKEMLVEYDLEDNTWLSRLFKEKEKWALVYGRATFNADITTTQRSESMNSSIKKYVSYRYDLLRFFHHFQRLVDDRRYNELVSDFKANQTAPALPDGVQILREAAKVYTPPMFKWFQAELFKGYDCSIKLLSDNESLKVYEVVAHGKSFHHTVTFDSADNTIDCSCKKFESAGILCSHALKILSANDVKIIPNQYILKRWRKDVRDQVPNVSCFNAYDNDDLKGKITRRYRDLAQLHTELVTIAAESDEAYEIALSGLQKTLGDVKNAVKNHQKPPEDVSVINNPTHEVFIDESGEHVVKGVKIKERVLHKDKSVRPKNALEKITGKKRSKKVDNDSKNDAESQVDCLDASSQPFNSTGSSSQNQMNSQIEMQMPGFQPSHQQNYSIPFCSMMNFTSPFMYPNIQFPYDQMLGGSSFGMPYQQGYIVSNQQLLTNFNGPAHSNTVITEEQGFTAEGGEKK